MKFIIFFTLLIHVVLSLTNKQCSKACRFEYDTGGRRANNNDKGSYGFNNNDIDCTCIFPWINKPNKNACDNYCNQLNYQNKFCHYVHDLCLVHVGLVY